MSLHQSLFCPDVPMRSKFHCSVCTKEDMNLEMKERKDQCLHPTRQYIFFMQHLRRNVQDALLKRLPRESSEAKA